MHRAGAFLFAVNKMFTAPYYIYGMINRLLLFVATACTFASCAKLPIDPSLNPYKVNMPADTVTFAVIGDYGKNTPSEEQVSNMVHAWNPEFIITTGDNNYTFGAAGTIKQNIGNFYCDYIYNPDAPETQKCAGRATAEKVNRFFPSPGNHDHYSAPAMQPYLDYFTLPGDERNYDFVWGPVHLFSINSGISGKVSCCDSPEGKWFAQATAASHEPFKFAYFHHPPYSVSNHGHNTKMQWPFSTMGISAVLNGHDHVYERINDKTDTGMVYMVIGNSGTDNLYKCTSTPIDTARFDVVCRENEYGAMKVRANRTTCIFEYYTVADPVNPVDVYIIHK